MEGRCGRRGAVGGGEESAGGRGALSAAAKRVRAGAGRDPRRQGERESKKASKKGARSATAGRERESKQASKQARGAIRDGRVGWRIAGRDRRGRVGLRSRPAVLASCCSRA